MAHLVETMAWNGETPWHGLGVEVGDNLSPQEMLVAAGLDWEVEKRSLSARSKDGKVIAVPDQKLLVRSSDNAALSIVGKGWNPVQNSEAFAFFDDFIKSGDMKMHTAGSLDGGRMVWALAKVGETFAVNGQDEVESYLLFSNPHQFGRTINVRFTPIRVVCNNTLTLSLRMKSDKEVTLNHRKKFEADEVKVLLGVAKVKMDQYAEMAKFLSSKRHNPESLQEYFSTLYPSPESSKKEMSTTAKNLMELVPNQPGHEMAAGTWWDAFNTVTFHADHVRGREADTRLQASWYGTVRNHKIKAMDLAMEFAQVA